MLEIHRARPAFASLCSASAPRATAPPKRGGRALS
jgi:hypothetical protein